MSAKRPSKLSDIFNMTNAVVRPRKDGSSSRLGRTLDIDGITSRYRRNEMLIDPRAFHLITEYDTLRKYKVFGVYKPPFAPMRRIESYENHHRVSVESYISAALKSRDMEAVVAALKRGEDPNAPYRAPTSFNTATGSSSSGAATSDATSALGGGLQVRVVNDLPAEAAGPILVHIADPNVYIHNDFSRYHFEALVYGHVTLRSAEATEEAMRAIRDPSNKGKVGIGGIGTMVSDGATAGVSAVAADGMIRAGYAGTSAAIGNVIEISNLALLYPSLSETASGEEDSGSGASVVYSEPTLNTSEPTNSSASSPHQNRSLPTIRMADLPRQRLTSVPRRSLSPSMLRAAKKYLSESHPDLVQKAEADAEEFAKNTVIYKQLMAEHAVKMAEYEAELEAFNTRVKEEGISLTPLNRASVGIMPRPGEREIAPPSRKLAEEMLGKPKQPVAPPPPPQPQVQISAPSRTDAPIARVSVRSFGFYATHPVTVIRFSAQTPTTATAPDLLRFVRAVTGSYALGDPMAKKDTNNSFVKSLKAGDKDFGRVFVNLRALGVNVYQRNPMWGDEALLSSANNRSISETQRANDLALAETPWLSHPKYLEFTCDGSLDALVSDSQLMMKRSSKISLTDGFWNPTMRAGL